MKFLEHESKNWIFEFFEKKKKPSKNSAFLKNTIQRTELFANMTQIFFSKYDSKNLTLHFTMTQRLFFKKKKKTQRISTFFDDSQTWTFLFQYFFQKKKNSKNWLFSLTMTLKMYFFEVRMRLTELIFFFSIRLTELIFFFLNVTFFVTLNFFFEFDSKIWSSPIRLRGITFFLWYVSKNSTSLSYELFLHDSKNLTFFNTSQIFFLMSQRVEPLFEYDSKNWPFFFEYDAKNWTFFFSI